LIMCYIMSIELYSFVWCVFGCNEKESRLVKKKIVVECRK